MAASVAGPVYVSGQGGPAVSQKVKITGLVSGQLVACSHTGVSGQAPQEVYVKVETRPSSGVGICYSHESDDTTNNTSSLRFVASDGVSALADAVVYVTFKWYVAA